MSKTNRTHMPVFKAQVALAALKGDSTIRQIAAHFQIHVNLVAHGKKQLLQGAANIFTPAAKGLPPPDTAHAWTNRLEESGGAVSMDGKGRSLDNIFVERLWRSVKYEYAYPCRPESVRELERGPRAYLAFYNPRRIHPSLDYRPPAEVHPQESRRVQQG